MRKTATFAITAILTACGVATVSNDAAESATQKARHPRQDPRAGLFYNYDQGGMAGCFDPNLSGYARRAAERAGGQPCATTTNRAGTGGAINAQGGSWAGRYIGPFDGGQGEVVISGPEPNRLYNVQMSVAGGGCSGQADGFNAPRGNVLTLHVQTGNQADGFGECTIALTRQGGTLRVSESGSCTDLHGMSCGFVGRATRR